MSAKGVKSVSLLHYLGQQQDRSRQQDEEEGDALKRQGLLPKAQLPLGPSHLTLDPQVLQDLGTAYAHTHIGGKGRVAHVLCG